MSCELRYICHSVGMLEVPDEISLIYTISGCPLRCAGCHSADLRDPRIGELLDAGRLLESLSLYRDLASCVCFLGGEWYAKQLVELLRVARGEGLATCLYSGLTTVDDRIAECLDYVKLGPFIPSRGGLDRAETNQIFMDLRSGENLTHRFQTR